MDAEPELMCDHREFAVLATVIRIADSEEGPVNGYAADITVSCHDCDEPFVWLGLPLGVDGGRPTSSVDGKVLRAPIRPLSSDDSFGSGVPGFSIVPEVP